MRESKTLRYIAAVLSTSIASAQLEFKPPVITGNVTSSALDEISGAFGLRSAGNEGKLITVHDSDADYMYVINGDGSLNSRINIVGDDWRDAEEVIGYTDSVTNTDYVILCEFGDNPASRDKKYLFRFEEPAITGADINITDFTKIAYRLPATPVLEKGTNRGDFEGAFADPIDGKIYLFSKRMAVNHIYSLPIQDTYTGTQTLTFEGLMHSDVAQEFGGIISPANCVAAAISRNGNNALIKTYNKVYQFTRTEGRTWVDVLVNDAPTVDDNYVGLGAAPNREPQGESITFNYNDGGYFTVSEYRGYIQVPLFFYGVITSKVPNIISLNKANNDIAIVVENLPDEFIIEMSTDLNTWSVYTGLIEVTTINNIISTIVFEDTHYQTNKCFFRIGFTN